jgi:DNA-binding transcriptional MerR regulator
MISTYTIKDLSQITRIKPHTLRVWEQRYGIMNPQRTEINTRLYCQEDLKYLLNVVLLYHNGHKISTIAKLGKEELSEKVKLFSAENQQFPTQIQALVVAMLDLDEARFEKQLNSNILSFGLEDTIIQIVYPFLAHIGILWQTNSVNPSQEHFITNLIRQKLIVAIDGIPPELKKPEGKIFMLYLPEGELHEISLLFAWYILKRNGQKVIYLGQSLPMQDLKIVEISHKPDVILTVITSSPSQEDVQPYLIKLKSEFPETKFWLTGFQIVTQELDIPENFTVVYNPATLKELLH